MTFNEGIMLERLSGITEGHQQLLDWIDRLAVGMTAYAMEQSRARYPDSEGYVERDGVRIFYEVYGRGEPTVLLLPTWSIIHSRQWKMQIPYLARHCRVVTFDGRGNGRSDRPTEASAYAETRVRRRRAGRAGRDGHRPRGHRLASPWAPSVALLLAAEHPERVDRAVFIGPAYHGGGTPLTERLVHPWDEALDTDEGWAKYNQHYWLRDYQGFLEFFFSQMLHRAALDQADRGLRRLGARDDARDARRSRGEAPAL